MSTLKVVYFPLAGRVQPIRYLLEDNGIEYEFEGVPPSEWATYKPKTMFGQLPYVVDGDLELAQSGAIMRHLARKHDLYGTNDVERAKIDMVFEAFMDIFVAWAKMLYAGDKHEEEKVKFDSTRPEMLQNVENVLSKNEDGKGFFVGKKISYADYGMLDLFHNLNKFTPGCLESFPLISAFYNRMCEREKIKSFMNRDDIKNMVVTASGKI